MEDRVQGFQNDSLIKSYDEELNHGCLKEVLLENQLLMLKLPAVFFLSAKRFQAQSL